MVRKTTPKLPLADSERYEQTAPLGGLSYPEGFRHFLQPALENDRIRKIRFVLDSSSETVMQIWNQVVLPLTREWVEQPMGLHVLVMSPRRRAV